MHPDATFVEYGYDAAGNLATVQDENHPLPNTRYEYDAASRLREVRQTLGGGEVVTRYEYDDEANLIRVTDPNGNVTSYLYRVGSHLKYKNLPSATSPLVFSSPPR